MDLLGQLPLTQKVPLCKLIKSTPCRLTALYHDNFFTMRWPCLWATLWHLGKAGQTQYTRIFLLRWAQKFLVCCVKFLLAWATGEKPKEQIIFCRIYKIAFVIINIFLINCKLNYYNLALINKYPSTLCIYPFIQKLENSCIQCRQKKLDKFAWRVNIFLEYPARKSCQMFSIFSEHRKKGNWLKLHRYFDWK